MDYYKKQEFSRRAFYALRITLICLFVFFAVCIVIFNIFMAVNKSVDNDKNKDYPFVNDSYVVRVSSSAWANYYSRDTLLVVSPVPNAEIVEEANKFDASTSNEGRNRYLIKTKEDDGISHYTIGYITLDVNLAGDEKSGVFLIDAVDVVGKISNEIYVVGVLGDPAFIIGLLVFAILCCLSYVIFIHSKTGEQIRFDEIYAKYIKKETGFKKYYRWQKGDYAGDKSDKEQFMESVLINIINDSKGYKKNVKITLNDVKNAIIVINEKDFTSLEKSITYLSALNLLNEYVTSLDAISSLRKNFFFEKDISLALKVFLENESLGIDVVRKNNEYAVLCNGFEFNFKCEDDFENVKDDDWSGVKVKKYAQYVFNEFYNKEFDNYKFSNKMTQSLNKIISIIDKNLK